MSYDNVHLPRGYEVAIQTDTATPNVYTDLGVTYDDGSVEFTYDKTEWTGSQGEPIKTFYNNMAINATFTLAQIQLVNINRLLSGASAYSTTAATPVSVTDEDLLTGAWALNTFIPFANQSGAATVPTSITLANAGALVLDTDYIIVQSAGIWGVVILDTADTDIDETLELNYTYTPAATSILTAGSSSIDVVPRSLRIRKSNPDGLYFTFTVYSATQDDGFSMAFPRWDSTDPVTLPVTMTGKLDTSRTNLDQLFRIVDEGF